jgi:hypothetical protein
MYPSPMGYRYKSEMSKRSSRFHKRPNSRGTVRNGFKGKNVIYGRELIDRQGAQYSHIYFYTRTILALLKIRERTTSLKVSCTCTRTVSTFSGGRLCPLHTGLGIQTSAKVFSCMYTCLGTLLLLLVVVSAGAQRQGRAAVNVRRINLLSSANYDDPRYGSLNLKSLGPPPTSDGK